MTRRDIGKDIRFVNSDHHPLRTSMQILMKNNYFGDLRLGNEEPSDRVSFSFRKVLVKKLVWKISVFRVNNRAMSIDVLRTNGMERKHCLLQFCGLCVKLGSSGIKFTQLEQELKPLRIFSFDGD
nr:hypothetical protein [Tanacetum cinerariifolium]